MNHDDPIAQLRALDPADEKEIETLVAALAGGDRRGQIVARPQPSPPRARLSRRPRLALLAVAAAVAAVVVTALTNPFSRSGGISSAEAKAQVARALDLRGAWHIGWLMQYTSVKGSAAPRFVDAYHEDVWHAPDGRLLIQITDRAGASETVLYANGERRTYNAPLKRLQIHRYAVAGDMRDEERAQLPPTAADLYRAAYRVGKVRLAGVETLNGRKVYRLAFDWRNSHYTLIFDAKRQVPISSESRFQERGSKFFATRVRYAAYERIAAGPALERRLALPPLPSGAKTVRDVPLILPTPVEGASARQLAASITARTPNSFPATAAPARASYVIVRHLRGGAVVAFAVIPDRATHPKTCFSVIEIAHPAGEAFLEDISCGGQFSTVSRNGETAMVGGSTGARRIVLKFANGATIRARLRAGVFLATFPASLGRDTLSLVTTKHDGTVSSEPWPMFGGGAFPSSLTR